MNTRLRNYLTGKENLKSRKIDECCGQYVVNFDEDTKILHSVMEYTENLLLSKILSEKSDSILVILNILMTHLNEFCKNKDIQDDGTVFEKKSGK